MSDRDMIEMLIEQCEGLVKTNQQLLSYINEMNGVVSNIR